MGTIVRHFLAPSLLLLLLALPAHGAPPKPRPYTGSGLLVIRPLPLHELDDGDRIILYREPGIGRIMEKDPAGLPLLIRIIEAGAGEFSLAVMGRKGNWLKIAYDDAGREGWLAMERRWQYSHWEEFLPGRFVRLLPGLKKEYGAVRREPSPAADELAPLSPDRELRVELLQGDWLRVSLDPQTAGWLRWRDEGGRFLVSVRADNDQQNH